MAHLEYKGVMGDGYYLSDKKLYVGDELEVKLANGGWLSVLYAGQARVAVMLEDNKRFGGGPWGMGMSISGLLPLMSEVRWKEGGRRAKRP